ncbi:MAG: hypothetical protein IPK82_29770 [Polyangiaceae bacterium]|nr:hypothetical protein [Polyangiaceae bacterium]
MSLRQLSAWKAVVVLAAALFATGCDGGDSSSTGGKGGDGTGASGGAGGTGGSTTSAGGTGGSCGATEVCGDGIDNDCDGQTDEDCICNKEGETKSCYEGPAGTEGVGACKAGTATCQADLTLGPCEGAVLPAEEICDGVDNDCNGSVDDNTTDTGGSCNTGLQGECADGTVVCEAGNTTCMQNVQASAELCDNLDNDCNGTVDDATTDTGGNCDTGLMGVCAAGTDTCVNGLIECAQNVMGDVETCDALDNDCDGAVDNGNPGGDVACNTGLQGACSAGTTACTAGAIVCNQNVMSAAETCDAIDNDCDGAVDNGNPGGGGACNTGLQGVCAAGTNACINGAVACVQNMMPSAETCDGVDQDCDGTVDNGNPGGAVACNTGLQGICSAGTTACTNGAIVCNQNLMAGAEMCDGLDNDCNGAVDNGNPGGGAACNTGLQGICAAGTTACTGGAVVCNQNQMAAAETCNNLDDDCNGVVDNGNPGGGAACTVPNLLPPCAAGTQQCQAGVLTCVSTTPPATETCDNVDNDCDGMVDDGPLALAMYFYEDFSDNGAGWTMDASWTIGSATVSSGQGLGSPDPANDYTTTGDNGIAGVVIGGNYGTALVPFRYITSPVINTAAAAGKVFLSFRRWLNSDYPPYVTNVVQVWNGTAWNTVYTSPASTFIQDNSWVKVQYEITAYKAANMQIRIGYNINNAGVVNMSGWNIDDVVVSNSPHPSVYMVDEFSGNSNAWTFDTSWQIGATAVSTGHTYAGPDPAADHTLGTNNGVMGAIIAGNVPINHPYYYTTSKQLNTAGAEVLNLNFWRWLNSDYANFMINQVQVYNGSAWQTVFQTGGSPGVNDTAWTQQNFNILAHKAANMQVRIGYTATTGAFTVSGWNVDDLLVTGGTVCQ